MNHVMRAILLLILPVSLSLGCLPNPQSEWVTSEGGEQRATTDDPTILAGSTLPDGHWVHHEHTHAHVAHASHGSRAGHRH